MTSSSNRRPSASTTAVTNESDAPAPALDLSVTKIAGGALAAVTTAVAASFLGVSGTLTGAAFGSIVSSVAAALYAASLKTAHTRIRSTRTVITRSGAAASGDPQDPSNLPGELTGRSIPLYGETMVSPVGDHDPHRSAGVVPPLPGQRVGPPPRRGLPWKPIAVLAGVVFLVAMAAIFVTEVFLGHPLSNSQETGTTVTRVVQGGGAPVSRSTGPAETDETSSTSPSDSVSPSTETGSTTDPDSPSPGETTSDPAADESSSDGGTTTDPGQGGQDPATSDPAAPTQSPVQGGSAAADPNAGVGGGAGAVSPTPGG
jgi:hypothetical protein